MKWNIQVFLVFLKMLENRMQRHGLGSNPIYYILIFLLNIYYYYKHYFRISLVFTYP